MFNLACRNVKGLALFIVRERGWGWLAIVAVAALVALASGTAPAFADGGGSIGP